MINNRDCFFYKKSDFINRLQDISSDSVCYIADTQQIYTHGRYFECNVTQDVVEQLIQNHGYLTAADLPVLTGGASPTPGEYVTGVSVGGHNVNVQKGKLSEINVGTASKLETPRKIELSGDLSGSIMFDGSQDVNIETIVHNSTTADRLTTPRTISLSSQATGQVSFDGSGNVNIPVTVNELDSKNSNNRDLNSLVTLNGYGGSLFYGIGGNTSVNKPSGVDWFGLFSFKSASGNYTTQILGSNNRLYSRSNADTSLGSWNTIAYLTDNVASATKLKNTRTFTISDGTNSGTTSNFDGTGNVTLRLPGTIKANIVGDITGDITGDVIGDLHGNADTATKLQTGRNINGTLFDGTRNITTAQWGTARNLTIGNSTKSVNGSANISWTLSEIGAVNKAGDTMTGTLNMQAGINLAEADGESWHLHGIFATNDYWDIAGYNIAKDDGYLDIRTGDNGDEGIRVSQWDSSEIVREAWLLNKYGNTQFPGIVTAPEFRGTLSGNASTASKLATARTITLTGDASGSASFDGSANISIPVVIANDSHTHATSASSNATTNLTITAGGTTATIADLYATYADQLRTARTISLTGDVTGSTSFNGAGNVSITTTVANNSHTHTFANITDKPISASWSQGNNNNITTAQFLDLLEEAGAFKYGWFHARGVWSYGATCNITDTGYGTLDLAGSAILVWGVKSYCTILVIPPLNSGSSSTVALGNIYIYVKNGTDYVSGWRKIAKFEDIDWNNIINKPSSFTPSSHTHTISQISNLNANWDNLLANAPSAYLTRWPSISEVTGKQNLTVQFNGTTQGGGAYNGTVARTINITPNAIGAATSSHSHSNYVQKSGDTMTGALTIRTSDCPLYIQGGSSVESYLKVRLGGTDKSAFGYNSSLGTFLYSYPYGGYLSLTDSGLARIYKGNSLVGTLWHSGNDGSGSGLNADLLDGYDSTAFDLSTNLGTCQDYGCYVIGLMQITDYTTAGNHANGELILIRQNGNNPTQKIIYSLSTRYSSTNVRFGYLLFSTNSFVMPCTFTHNGKKWAGFNVTTASAYSMGIICKRDGTRLGEHSTPFLLKYKVSNTEQILNSEVNDSLVVNGSDIIECGVSATRFIGPLEGNASTASELTTARTINGTSFNGTANITTANWGTARTITIGNTGKSVNGSGNVSWSLAEIGAAATSHSHSYLPLAGGNMTGIINTDDTKGNWISGKTNAAIRYNRNSSIDSNSAWYFYNMKSASGNVIAFGGLGDNIGFYTFDAARTENGTDSSFLCNTNTGVWTFTNTPTVKGTSVSLNGHTHSWSSITSKPSSFTPSSHTHPISQITNRGTLTFTGAATGSYDGSGNLTINIPSGGMSSVSWSDISGKPSTFTPSAHTHSASDITSGILALARIPTGTTSNTVALGNHTHSGYATQSWVNSQGFIKSATDTKNTAGSTNTSSKLFLIGATSQAANPVTYSNVSVYTQSGQLYASQMNATNGFFETSDARLKDFKEDIKALDTVDQIPTKYFTWKEDKSKDSQIGTSAQEVEKLYPELVSKTGDNTLTVDYAKLSIIALAAIKELKAEIQSLKEEIKQLKSK